MSEGAPSGFSRGFPGGFRVFTTGRDAASRFRVKAPWRARAGAGAFERALIGALTFLLAIPVAVLLLGAGLILLVVFLGCFAVFVALGLAAYIVRRVLGVAPRRAARAPDEGRENVRVLSRQEPRE